MNSVERCVAAVTFATPDRIPVIPVLLMQGAKELRVGLEKYFSSGELMAEGQIALVEKYDHDAVFGFPHVVQDVLPFGAGLRYFETGPPSVDRMCIHNYDDIKQIKVPDPREHEQTKQTLKATERLAQRVKGQKLIVGAVTGPFSLPSMLMGTEKYMKLLFSQVGEFEAYFPRLMEICVEYASSWANMQLEAGADLIVVADGTASNTILRRSEFQAKALPIVETVFSKINGLIGYEFVGEAQDFLQDVRTKGAAVFLLGSGDDMHHCKNIVGSSAALLGNINNIKLLRWTPERVEFEVKKLIESVGITSGIIIGNQGPEIPYNVPDANIKAMVEAVKKYGVLRLAA